MEVEKIFDEEIVKNFEEEKINSIVYNDVLDLQEVLKIEDNFKKIV